MKQKLRAQRLSASQSIPHHGQRAVDQLSRVLNAFRHHSLFHTSCWPAVKPWTIGCSTPFGITVYSTFAEVPSLSIVQVLNAFRHHSLFHHPECLVESHWREVLNAFRHHSLFHTIYYCEWLQKPKVLNAFRHHSLFHALGSGFGVRRPCVLNAFRHHSLFHQLNRALRAVRQLVLNAFRHHSLFHANAWPIATRKLPRAQRLSASQSIPQYYKQKGGSACEVLNAFRHHSLFHDPVQLQDRIIPPVLNAFRHHSLFHLSRRGERLSRMRAQRLSASQSIPPFVSVCGMVLG